MIKIHMDPTLVELGPLVSSWHALFTVVAIVVAVFLTSRLIKGTGITREQVYSTALWAIPGGIVGARLFHVVDSISYYSSDPLAILAIQRGGLSIYGAIIGGSIAGALYAKFKGIPIGRLADATAPALILAQAVGRIGDIINGEHFGTPTTLPWGVVYTNPNSPSYGLPAAHLAVGYELLWDLVVLGMLLWLRRRLKIPGLLYWSYLALYSGGRFFITFLRQDTLVLFSLTQAQVIAILSLLVAIPVLFYLQRKDRQRVRVTN